MLQSNQSSGLHANSNGLLVLGKYMRSMAEMMVLGWLYKMCLRREVSSIVFWLTLAVTGKWNEYYRYSNNDLALRNFKNHAKA